jgi:hypothetical protein
MPRWVTAALVTLLAACGGRTGGPRGDPLEVVRAAPERTLRHATARVDAAAPDARSGGPVRLGDPRPGLPVTGPGSPAAYPELSFTTAVVDLVRGAAEAVPYGGTAVRGVSTFRYETVIEVDQAVRATPQERRATLEELAGRLRAPAFYADVWVDGEGRLRRVQLPVEKTVRRPGSRERRVPKVVTVDYFDFSG